MIAALGILQDSQILTIGSHRERPVARRPLEALARGFALGIVADSRSPSCSEASIPRRKR